MVAPGTTIDWGNLCHFFRLLYTFLLDGLAINDALSATVNYARGYYREYRSIGVEGDREWSLSGKTLPTTAPAPVGCAAGESHGR